VDTALGHLAGALGVPVWLALSTASDWRWLRDRPDSPWYPSMRLFRQSRLGDWEGVFRRIATELSARVKSDTGTQRPETGEYDRGVAGFARGAFAAAEAAFRAALRHDPGQHAARHNLGVALAKLSRPDEAVVELREFLRNCPESADGHNNLGLAHLDAGRPP